ncbi:MAG: peptide deformylase [Candidatus Saelkia tenebricola]|nr:peptide deformylase [Candidatus Saelkia tenebricola]
MMNKIVIYPKKVLKRKTKLVKQICEDEINLIRGMIEVMFESRGVGLSANQVGVNKRIFVTSPRIKREEVFIFINPKIIKKYGKIMDEEGCLSVPGAAAFIRRYREVEVEALGVDGKLFKIKAEGLLARIVQHEIDHLNGKIFLDRVSSKERRKHFKRLKIR